MMACSVTYNYPMRTDLAVKILSSSIAAALLVAGCAKSETSDVSPSSASPVQAEPEESGGEFCEVLQSDTLTSATVFGVPLFAGSGVDQENITTRIALLGQITSTPNGLADDLETWRDYLGAVAQTTTLAEMFAVGTDESEAAGEALSEEYVKNCL